MVRLALWQGRSVQGDTTQAVAEAEAALRAAGAMGADAVVLPELWMQGYNQPDIPSRLLSADAPVFDRLEHLAKSAGVGLIVGYAEASEKGSFNSALCLFPDGRPRLTYRKLQLYGEREKALFQPGAGYVTFDLGGTLCAMLICYDIEFAPHVEALARLGVEVIFVPTANMQPFTHVADVTVPAMAANHGVSIVYANYCGAEGDLAYVGASLIAGPHGEVLARAGGATPALLVADLPPRDPLRLSTQLKDFQAVQNGK